jgi:hypothetical protein
MRQTRPESQNRYAGLREAFESIWRRNKDRDLISLLNVMLDAGELELCEDLSHGPARFWERGACTRVEERRLLLTQMHDRAQWALSECILRGELAFTVDMDCPPRIRLTGRGNLSYKGPRRLTTSAGFGKVMRQ